eukprot:2365458-Alexandrium_andersonii.AAC.1
MSASLVGSEMCIRDSMRGCLEEPNGACGALVARRRPHTTPEGCTWSASCLLYTSDAADDM